MNEKVGLSQADFVRICPSLIHQLRAGFCDQEKESNKNVLESTDLDMLCGKFNRPTNRNSVMN